jgi:hypothetical protein
MSRMKFPLVNAALVLFMLAAGVQAQDAKRPPIETMKVPGTENVYSSSRSAIVRFGVAASKGAALCRWGRPAH